MIEIDAEGEGPPRNNSWGNGRFVESNFTLVRADGYEVDLEDMKDSSRILDWIAQVSNKTWAEPTDIGHLVRAISTEYLAADLAGLALRQHVHRTALGQRERDVVIVVLPDSGTRCA